MPFTVEEFRDLIRLLEEQPEWRGELRRLVLTDELLALPDLVRALAERVNQLAEAQRRTEERLEQLAEAQRRTEERLEQLAEAQRRIQEQLAQLVEAQRRTQEQLAQLVEAQRRTQEQLAQLVEAQLRMKIDLERLKGIDLERRYQERGYAYFSQLILRAHVLSGDELVGLLNEAVDQGQLSQVEADDILQADVVVRGRRRDDGTEVYLVAEVSWGVGASDVWRASRRAELLAKAGISTMPVVAGVQMSPYAQEAAQGLGVRQVTDGRFTPPEASEEPPGG